MSRNLSRTLFYEFYKSDPNFIYESVEEYRSYKSDPNFAGKTIEQYRRIKALEKKEVESPMKKPTPNGDEELSSSEERYEAHLKFCSVKILFLILTLRNSQVDVISATSENETETVNDIQRNENAVTENMVNETERELNELKSESIAQQVFERSLEQFWNSDEEEDEKSTLINSEARSACSSDLSRLTSETELDTNMSKKKAKSKFRIPKTRSTINFNKVKSRYMNVFKTNMNQ